MRRTAPGGIDSRRCRCCGLRCRRDLAAAVAHVAGRFVRAAGVADRPVEAGRPVPAAGAGQGAVADRAGAPRPGPGRRDAARHPGAGAGRAWTSSPTARSGGRATPTTSPPRWRASTSTTPARRWTAAATPTRCRASSAPIHRPAAVEVGDLEFLQGEHGPHGEDDRAGPVHDEPAGAERPLPGPRGRGDGLRGGGQRGDQGPARGGRRHRPDRRAVHAGPAGRRPRVRAGRTQRRARRRHRHDRGAHLLRLRRDHPRTAVGLLVPARAGRLPGRPDLDRDRAVRASTSGCSRTSRTRPSCSA